MQPLSDSPERESEQTTATTKILQDYATYTTTSGELGFTVLGSEPIRPKPSQLIAHYGDSLSSKKLSNTEDIEQSASSVSLSSIDEKTSKLLREIAKEHFKIESELYIIAIYSRKSENSFLLIEVNEEAIPTGYIEPFYFAPTDDFPWPVHVADITYKEWTKLERNIIKMPSGWSSEPSLIFHRHEVIEQ